MSRVIPVAGEPCLKAARSYIELLADAGLPLKVHVSEPVDGASAGQMTLEWSADVDEADADGSQGWEDEIDGAQPAPGRVLFEHYLRTVQLLARSRPAAEKWLRSRSAADSHNRA